MRPSSADATEALREAVQIAERTVASLVGWRLQRLRRALEGPLAVVGTGGTLALATLWARLHEGTGQPGWSLTPGDYVARPLPTGTRTLFLSATGRHHDILAAAREAVHRRAPLHAIVHDRSAPLCDIVRAGGGDVTVLPRPPQPATLADPRVAVPMLALAGAMHGGLDLDALESLTVPAPPTTRPGFVLCLGTGLAAPAAADFAARCRESGLALAIATDRRDATHGDLLQVDPARTWLVHFYGPAEASRVAAYDARLPADLAVTRVEAWGPGGTAAVALCVAGGLLFRATAARFQVAPRVEDLPEWMKALYRLPEAPTH
ncbi:MAG: hypothetical protein H6706_01100 [Myxococcales bacterium]|nr:hypothetical protein [Myxococcales bacterium]